MQTAALVKYFHTPNIYHGNPKVIETIIIFKKHVIHTNFQLAPKLSSAIDYL